VNLATWKHPGTKQAHMIDFMPKRKGQRQLCRDVRVCRSAWCWSDHHLVRGKIQLKIPRKKKCDTSVPLAVHTLSRKDSSLNRVCVKLLLQHPHCTDDQPEDSWERPKRCIVEAAEEWLDAVDTLMPLVKAKTEAYCSFLHDHTTSSKKEFRQHQRTLKKAVDEAKVAQIGKVITEAECAMKDGKQRWMSTWLLCVGR